MSCTTGRPGPRFPWHGRILEIGVLAAVVVAFAIVGVDGRTAGGSPSVRLSQTVLAEAPSIGHAQGLFYNGRYEQASAEALELRSADPGNLAAYELRTSSIHFQIRRLLGSPKDKDDAFKRCAPCPALVALFADEMAIGVKAARARVQKNARDVDALFFLGKIDLNFVWLQLDTLGHRTGWSEFREARKSLDAALKVNPEFLRAQVAHGWIDYIVDTRVPRGLRWLLGGGDKKKGLLAVRQAAATATDFFVRIEALFGLWDMQIREKKIDEAVISARSLAHDFPENAEVAKFLAQYGAARD